ncbi:MAG TPA: TRAP transporter substrate-binding protein DctP [Nannocystaceae bacterium]|nr:TRAP transporter substrate-binding protein DctP [Nannocystaceae bacterium]
MSMLFRPTRRRFIYTTAAASAAATFVAPYIAKGASKKLRIATLAPKGSSWAKAFEKTAREVKERTAGEVEMKIYDGGVMGDEGAMIRKMRHGQLDGAAVTSVGLGEINTQLLMLQLPLLFKDYAQLDYVRGAMSSTFEGMLEAEGFKFGAWGDVGWIFLFSNTPVKTPTDIKSTKMWVWDADPVSKAVMAVAKVNAVPLGVPDVLPSLETGLIDAFTNSPYGSIALQWYTKARYVTNLKLSIGIGGSVLTQKAWQSISPEAQQVLTDITAENYGALLKRIRSDNKKAMSTLKEKGLEVVEPGNIVEWANVAVQVREKLISDKTLDGKLVETMLGHLKSAPS